MPTVDSIILIDVIIILPITVLTHSNGSYLVNHSGWTKRMLEQDEDACNEGAAAAAAKPAAATAVPAEGAAAAAAPAGGEAPAVAAPAPSPAGKGAGQGSKKPRASG